MTSIKRKTYLFSSDIASFIGQNIWDYVTPFERLWKKVDTAGYENALAQMKNRVNEQKQEIEHVNVQKVQLMDDLTNKRITKRQYAIKLKVLDNAIDQVTESLLNTQDKIDEIDLTQQQRLEKVVGTSLMLEMSLDNVETSTKRVRMNDAITAMDIDDTRKDKYLKTAESFINKTHGTLKENEAIHLFNQKYGVKLDTSQQFLKASIGSHLGLSFDWFICGKVDGLYIDKTDSSKSYIVEVKNRTKAFFSTLRDYEKTQIQLYMYMLDLQQAKLVEKFKDKIRVTEIPRDDKYIELIIKSLEIFLSKFENVFLVNAEAKVKYASLTNDEKKVFLKRLYINDVLAYKLELFESPSEINCMIDDL
jgi:hypothetical protein